ncbi:hypothetical protein COOONC_21943, partial [Cooperia oncophora]
RKEHHKKWLEKTWDERVRQAALELQTQSEDHVRPRRRRFSVESGSREKSKEGSKEALHQKGSNEKVGSKEAGSKEKVGSKEAGSQERFGSNEKKGSKEGGGDDPFGEFVSKIGNMNQPHGRQVGGGYPCFM